MGSDEQAIRALNTQWIAAVNAADLDRLLGWMTDDVVLLNPGGAPIGREGFIATFSGAHRESIVRCTSEMEEVVVVGEVAYTRCRDSVEVTPRQSSGQAPGAGGETARFAGYRLTVWRKQAPSTGSGQGQWRLARDAHTLAPVASPGA